MKNHIEFENTQAQFTMIAIEGNREGEPFEMGGESWNTNSLPIHKIRLNDFWLCEYPITQVVWAYIMNGSDLVNSSRFQGQNHPIENVSWNDINDEFLPKLNKMTEVVRPKGTQYRLPTEAEWEYAAKGGKYWKTFSFKYSGSDKNNEVAWYDDNSNSETKPVGLKTPNLLGLYDMSGNVWEWCEDWYDSDFYKKCEKEGIVVNPCNRVEGTNRVLRGGSWLINELGCRPTSRDDDDPSNRDDFIGFRLVLFYPSV